MCNTGRLSRPFSRGLLIVSLLVIAGGCGGSKGKVSGKVYYKDKPLTVGMVQFFPEKQGGDFSSPIAADGSYSVAKLPPGPAKIAVISNTTNPLSSMAPMMRGPANKGMKGAEEQMKKSKPEGGGGDAGPTPFAATKGGESIPTKYNSPDESGLSITVTGGSQSFDIKLN